MTLHMQMEFENYYEYTNKESVENDSITPTDPSIEIQVKCKLCEQTNIERGNFQNHIYQTCPKAIVTCPTIANNCPWLGLREELESHLTICSYESVTLNLQSEYILSREPAGTSSGLYDAYLILDSKYGEFLPFSNVNLQEGHFQNQDIATAVKALLINKRCTSLDLFNKGISAGGAEIIASVLHNDTLLETFSLRNNLICDSGAQFLAHALSTNFHLKRLDLNSNSITDTGVRLLADMLKTNETLLKLTLSFNRISNEGVNILVDVFINYNSTLQWLCLAGNAGINDLSTHSIINLIRHNKSLKTLNFEDCKFSWWSKKQIHFYHSIHFKSHLNLLL